MSIDELEAAALQLQPKERARLAERLLDSLERLSPEENERIWAEEAGPVVRGTIRTRMKR